MHGVYPRIGTQTSQRKRSPNHAIHRLSYRLIQQIIHESDDEYSYDSISNSISSSCLLFAQAHTHTQTRVTQAIHNVNEHHHRSGKSNINISGIFVDMRVK